MTLHRAQRARWPGEVRHRLPRSPGPRLGRRRDAASWRRRVIISACPLGELLLKRTRPLLGGRLALLGALRSSEADLVLGLERHKLGLLHMQCIEYARHSAWAVHGQCLDSAWTLHAQRHMRQVALLLLPLRALPRELLPHGAELGGDAAQLELGRLLLLLERLALVRLGARRARRLVALAPHLVHFLLEVLAATAALLLLPLQRRRLALERLELGGGLGRRLPRCVLHAAELGLSLLDAACQRVTVAAQLGVRVLGLGPARDSRVELALEL